MKKLLALVLALVMTLGLATVGANAADYADADDINYTEAVEVLTALNVLGGDETGFRPADTLKRSEGAKIVAYLLLGDKAAEALTGGGKFADVPANHWAAGYIEYLASLGIVGGVGDNKFDPDGQLTATQFAKMLLVVLGYDAEIEKLVGDDWSINTQRLALTQHVVADRNDGGLFDGNPNVVGSAAVTREEAALYTLNTIKSPTVTYETKGTRIEVNGASITTGASNATYKLYDSTANTRYDHIGTQRVNTGVNGVGGTSLIVEFGEDRYPNLIRETDADDFMRITSHWWLDGKEIGQYRWTEDLLYTDEVTVGQLYKDLGLTETRRITANGEALAVAADRTVTGQNRYFIDGEPFDADNDRGARFTVNDPDDTVAIVKESTRKLGGPGVDTYVYYLPDSGEIRVCELNWYAGDVTGVYAATASKDAYVTVTTRNGTDYPYSGDFKTTDFAMDDVVVYQVHDPNELIIPDGNGRDTYSMGIASVTKAETVTGKMDNYVATSVINGVRKVGSVTLDGTKYTYSWKIANEATSEILSRGVEVTVVLDKYGYAIDIDDIDVQNLAVITKIGSGMGNWNDSNLVNLLFTDGTTASNLSINGIDVGGGLVTGGANVAALIKGATTANQLNVGDIVEYVVRSNGSYNLTLRADNVEYKNRTGGDNNIVTNGDAVLNGQFTVSRANGKTVFLIKDSAGNYGVYNGIKNVPTVVATSDAGNGGDLFRIASYRKATDSAATLVYIDAEHDAYTKTDTTIFVVGDPEVGRTSDATIGNYWEYPAFINGEATLLKVSERIVGYRMYESVSYNSNNIATLGNEIPAVHGSAAERNGTIGLGGVTYGYDTNVQVFYINENDEIVKSSVKAIPTDTAGTQINVWFNQTSSDDVTFIFWQKASARTLTIAEANTAGVLQAALNGTPGGVVIVGGASDMAGVIVNANLVVPSGTKLVVNGPVTVNSAAVVTVNGEIEVVDNDRDAVVENTFVVSNGTVNVTGTGSKVTAASITTEAQGHVEVDGGEISATAANQVSTIAGNSLVLKKGVLNFLSPLLVTGKFEVSSGTISVQNTFAVRGTPNVSIGGAKLTVADLDLSAATGGTVKIASGTTLEVTGTTTLGDKVALTLEAGTSNNLGTVDTSKGTKLANDSTDTTIEEVKGDDPIDNSEGKADVKLEDADVKVEVDLSGISVAPGTNVTDPTKLTVSGNDAKATGTYFPGGLEVKEITVTGGTPKETYFKENDTVIVSVTISKSEKDSDGNANTDAYALPTDKSKYSLSDTSKAWAIDSATANSDDSVTLGTTYTIPANSTAAAGGNTAAETPATE